MEPWLIAIFGPAGLLATVAALVRHRMNTRLIKHALDTKGEHGVDAVARAMLPWAEASKSGKVRRQHRKAGADEQQPVVQVRRQVIAPSPDESDVSARAGRTAG